MNEVQLSKAGGYRGRMTRHLIQGLSWIGLTILMGLTSGITVLFGMDLVIAGFVEGLLDWFRTMFGWLMG